MGRWWLTCALVALLAVWASRAGAQDERVRVSGTMSAALGDGGPAPAIGLAGGFRFAPHVGLELEGLYIPEQEFESDLLVIARQIGLTVANTIRLPGVSPQIFPTPRVEVTGRTVAFLSSVVMDLPVGRMRPYALLGGGIANVERKISVTFDPVARPPGLPSVTFPASRYSIAENSLALTAGAGFDVRVWRRLSVAADVRYLRLFAEGATDAATLQNITRVGGRVSWWF